MKVFLVAFFIALTIGFSMQEVIDGSLGGNYPLSNTNPVKIQLTNMKADLSVSVEKTVRGNFNVNVATISSTYTTPTFKKTPMTFLGVLSMNFTQVTSDSTENSVSVILTSWIPTFYLIDPPSYVVLLYNETTSAFTKPPDASTTSYGYSFYIDQAFGNVVKIGIFVYSDIEVAELDKTFSIYYPTAVMYRLGSDLKYLSYSFPSANYYTSSLYGSSFSVIKYYTRGTVISSSYAVLGRYMVSFSSSGLNMTNSFLNVQFQTNSQLFFDIESKLVRIDPDTITCLYYIQNNFYNPVSKSIENGMLTCKMNDGYSINHDFYVVAKVIASPTPTPVPSLSSQETAITLVKDKSISITMQKAQKSLYKIDLAPRKKITFSVIYSSVQQFRPKYFASTGYVPTVSKFDQQFFDGTGTVMNLDSKLTVTVYLLISNAQSNTNSLVLYPDVYDVLASDDPVSVVYIAAPIAGAIVLLIVLIGIAIVACILIQKKRNRIALHNGKTPFVPDGNNIALQSTPYYKV